MKHGMLGEVTRNTYWLTESLKIMTQTATVGWLSLQLQLISERSVHDATSSCNLIRKEKTSVYHVSPLVLLYIQYMHICAPCMYEAFCVQIWFSQSAKPAILKHRHNIWTQGGVHRRRNLLRNEKYRKFVHIRSASNYWGWPRTRPPLDYDLY